MLEWNPSWVESDGLPQYGVWACGFWDGVGEKGRRKKREMSPSLKFAVGVPPLRMHPLAETTCP